MVDKGPFAPVRRKERQNTHAQSNFLTFKKSLNREGILVFTLEKQLCFIVSLSSKETVPVYDKDLKVFEPLPLVSLV